MINRNQSTWTPAYLELFNTGDLQRRAKNCRQRLSHCDLCPHLCRADRTAIRSSAFCRTGERAKIYSYGAHHGEETPLVGRKGSGTIFFSNCNMRCVFCQNWEISHQGEGREVDTEELAQVMLNLQEAGCHNINLVSPSHVVAQILDALVIAIDQGLRLPLVYNSGGYDRLETLRLLDGVIDIYMPDMKFADSDLAKRTLEVHNYAEINLAAIREMLRQVGHLKICADGTAKRGLLIRHLVLPNNLAGTKTILATIAGELGTETYLNLMDQYRPCHLAKRYRSINRRINSLEFNQALKWAQSLGLLSPESCPLLF